MDLENNYEKLALKFRKTPITQRGPYNICLIQLLYKEKVKVLDEEEDGGEKIVMKDR
jgi:hypothetical protein